MAKTVTPAGAPGGAGAACAAGHKTVLFSQKVLAAQKPMTYTDLLATEFIHNDLVMDNRIYHRLMGLNMFGMQLVQV